MHRLDKKTTAVWLVLLLAGCNTQKDDPEGLCADFLDTVAERTEACTGSSSKARQAVEAFDHLYCKLDNVEGQDAAEWRVECLSYAQELECSVIEADYDDWSIWMRHATNCALPYYYRDSGGQ